MPSMLELLAGSLLASWPDCLNEWWLDKWKRREKREDKSLLQSAAF